MPSPSLLAAALLLPTGVQADPALAGRFVERDPAAGARAVAQGIERVAGEFPSLIRPLVRHYLEGVTRYCPTPSIDWDGPALVYACGDKELFHRVPDGVPFTFEVPGSDENPTVTITLKDERTLTMAFANELGGRTQTFVLQPDGTVTEHIVYHGDKLPVPLEYTLVFVAAPTDEP
jgi:hypothetical protein